MGGHRIAFGPRRHLLDSTRVVSNASNLCRGSSYAGMSASHRRLGRLCRARRGSWGSGSQTAAPATRGVQDSDGHHTEKSRTCSTKTLSRRPRLVLGQLGLRPCDLTRKQHASLASPTLPGSSAAAKNHVVPSCREGIKRCERERGQPDNVGLDTRE
jgi:hypothetical protein